MVGTPDHKAEPLPLRGKCGIVERIAHLRGDGFVSGAVDDEERFVELGHGGEIIVTVGDEGAGDLRGHRAQAGEGADRDECVELLPGREAERDAATQAMTDDDHAPAVRHPPRLGIEGVGIAREPDFVRATGIARIAAILRRDDTIALRDQRGEPVERVHRARSIAVEHE